jgi:hypothetical protein
VARRKVTVLLAATCHGWTVMLNVTALLMTTVQLYILCIGLAFALVCLTIWRGK